MSTQRYSVTPQPIETILAWVKSGEIAIPEIQRPFVWEATKARNLLDSLYQGYPVGYLIAWRNPTVKLKDGTPSAGKRILIDGQQRVTALMAALLGHEVLTKDYEVVRIRIAFHPIEEKFEVANPAIQKDPSWIPDIAQLFSPSAKMLQITKTYVAANDGVDEDEIFSKLEKLRKIVNNHVGIIELAGDLDIETVTEIFIRVNSAGAALSQADFAMSKIAANETYGGNLLRKAIDYFCHLAVAPEFYSRIKNCDASFAASEFFPKMTWIKDVIDDIYDPSYTDMLRVAFTSEFGRGKLQDLGHMVGRQHVGTLMRKMGISALYRKPRLSKPHPDHKVYPYLLRGLQISRANHVWAADITYIPMARGFCYLVAIMDWASRKVLAWRLSNTLDAAFCVEALKEAVARYGIPGIFNTDQGSQFTSDSFIEILEKHSIDISMDGKGRWMDNVFIERLWWSVKYQDVYLKAYSSIAELRKGLRDYFDFYNSQRRHQSLDRRTPDEVYWSTLPQMQVAI